MARLMQIRADLHTHAIGDGQFGPSSESLVHSHIDAAVAIGLDCIGVTDHDDLRPGLIAERYARERQLSLLVVPGMEITTDEGHHVVGVGLRTPIPRWKPLGETIARIRAAGGLCILPHPFFAHLRARCDVDAMERYNARYGDFDLECTGVPAIASSDAHSANDLRRSAHHTIVDVACRSWEGVMAAVRAGRVTAV